MLLITPLVNGSCTLSVETQKNHAETYTKVNNILNIDYEIYLTTDDCRIVSFKYKLKKDMIKFSNKPFISIIKCEVR